MDMRVLPMPCIELALEAALPALRRVRPAQRPQAGPPRPHWGPCGLRPRVAAGAGRLAFVRHVAARPPRGTARL
eukprot:2883929-Lingulodinium_polyedra.AAC.1